MTMNYAKSLFLSTYSNEFILRVHNVLVLFETWAREFTFKALCTKYKKKSKQNNESIKYFVVKNFK